MFKRISALIWLRNQQLVTNKNLLVQVLLPFLLVFLYKTFLDMKGIGLVFTCLSMVFSVSVGISISTLVSEEKEKKNIKTLLLSGVHYSEYIFSIFFYPIIITLLSILLLPILANADISAVYVEYLIVTFITAIIIMLLNLIVGLLSDTQSKAQVNSLPILIMTTFLPIFSSMKEDLKNIVDWTFMGAYTNLFIDETFHLTDKSVVVLLIWLVILVVATMIALRKSKHQNG